MAVRGCSLLLVSGVVVVLGFWIFEGENESDDQDEQRGYQGRSRWLVNKDFNMSSIAIIGPDGAGKTTITRMLQASSSLPLKYLYMGINIEASNFALLTSRLIEHLKRYRQKKSSVSSSQSQEKGNGSGFGGKLWAAARLANRLADEWYRQMLAWSYQVRGYIALYDRHFLFDFSLDSHDDLNQPLSKRLHRWCLSHFYPCPDLVIYLDAPAEVLFARKGEKTLQDLEARRQAFIRLGKEIPNFVLIDGTQPLEAVYVEVNEHIIRFCENRHGKRRPETSKHNPWVTERIITEETSMRRGTAKDEN